MFVVMAAAGVIVILLGMIVCTERVDQHYRNRRLMKPTTPPPFITTHTQCVDCGVDGDLLNLDRRCIYCHHKAHING